MVFGEMVRVKAGVIVGLGDFEPVLVVVGERAAVAVEVIEYAEFHLLCGPSHAPAGMVPILIICAGEATVTISGKPSRSVPICHESSCILRYPPARFQPELEEP